MLCFSVAATGLSKKTPPGICFGKSEFRRRVSNRLGWFYILTHTDSEQSSTSKPDLSVAVVSQSNTLVKTMFDCNSRQFTVSSLVLTEFWGQTTRLSEAFLQLLPISTRGGATSHTLEILGSESCTIVIPSLQKPSRNTMISSTFQKTVSG